MSMFEDYHYRWRETYHVLFDSSNCPTLERVEQALSALNKRYVLTNLSADSSGRFQSLTLLSPEDSAALDVCYTSGEEVLEHGAALAKEMETAACEADDRVPCEQIRRCDGRFDVLHFERVPELEEEADEAEEMLDPSSLLLVLGELSKITGGIAIDPQAGTILENGE